VEVTEAVNTPAATPATAEQLTEVEEQMTGFEKSTLRWAKTAVIMSGVAAFIVCGQWWEMHEGGVDTRNLAIAAGKQADRMKELTDQATVAADAAKSAAVTASAGLRPWIKITGVDLRPGIEDMKTLMFHWPPSGIKHFPQLAGKELPPMLQLKVSMLNIGHSPATDVEVVPEFFFHKFSTGKWHDEVVSEENRFCKSVAKQPPSGGARISFPSDPLEDNMGLSGVIKDSDITVDNGTRNISAAVLFCVNYKGLGDASYQTQAWFGLYEDNQISIPIGVDTNSEHLRLIREENGDHAY
jgi:hypothetical protein